MNRIGVEFLYFRGFSQCSTVRYAHQAEVGCVRGETRGVRLLAARR
jgi:hypothetical protein